MLTKKDIQFDQQHIWHPYSRMFGGHASIGVESAQGCELTLSDGNTVIDGMASWWSAIHGYNHPVLNAALRDQSEKMAHVMFGGLTHEPAVRLCQTLIEMTHEQLQHVFLADSGSVSVEVAMKMALQYWASLGAAQKNADGSQQTRLQTKQQFLSFRHGYHGDTFATMSVCDPENGMHSLFGQALPQQVFADAPPLSSPSQWQQQASTQNQHFIDQVKALLQEHQHQLAAVIIEPVVQGAGGMRFYDPRVLKALRQLCDQFDVLLILDEIATGFGRTGRLFAYEWADVCPDILCVGKALTGGYMTLAATLTTGRVAQNISDNYPHAFMHGPTFMGNPLACAVANASLDILLSQNWQQKVKQIESWLSQSLQPLAKFSAVKEVRVLGAIGVVEMQQSLDVPKLCQHLVEQGVWLRPYMNLIYMMPPYIIEQAQISKIADSIHYLLQQELV